MGRRLDIGSAPTSIGSDKAGIHWPTAYPRPQDTGDKVTESQMRLRSCSSLLFYMPAFAIVLATDSPRMIRLLDTTNSPTVSISSFLSRTTTSMSVSLRKPEMGPLSTDHSRRPRPKLMEVLEESRRFMGEIGRAVRDELDAVARHALRISRCSQDAATLLLATAAQSCLRHRRRGDTFTP